MVRTITLGLTALGALTLMSCSVLGRSPEPTSTAAPQPALPDRPEPMSPPASTLDPTGATPATPAPDTARTPELGADAASSEIVPSPHAAAEAMRTLPRDRDVPIGYVALGDSTVAGVGATRPEKNYVGRIFARLKDRYPAAIVHNLGVAGATSADVTRQQLPKAVALRPTLVTLSVGPNDITRGRDIAEYERNVDEILGTLARETEAVVVVNTLPDMAVSPIFTAQEKQIVGALARAFNDVLVGKAREYGAEVVEHDAPSRDEVPADTGLFAADNYHPSDAGYARWAEFMWRGVEARMEGSG